MTHARLIELSSIIFVSKRDTQFGHLNGHCMVQVLILINDQTHSCTKVSFDTLGRIFDEVIDLQYFYVSNMNCVSSKNDASQDLVYIYSLSYMLQDNSLKLDISVA